MNTTVPAAQHSRTCAIFASSHEQARNGQPGRFHPVPCDCHIEN
jgi:hypothetical protein